MNNKIFIIITITSLVVIGLSGCTDNSSKSNKEVKKFIGTWIREDPITGNISENETDMFSFYDGGVCTYIFPENQATYSVINSKLIVTLKNSGFEYTYGYVFSEDNSELTLTLEEVNKPDIKTGASTKYIKQSE